MINRAIATGCILVLGSILSGCRTPRYGESTFWIYVPNYTFNAHDSTGFPAEVILEPQGYTTNRISITINGEVMSPGEYSVPEHCSLLQGIGYAGGFAPSARATRVRVQDRTGATHQLVMQIKQHHNHRKIWCEPQHPNNSPNELETKTKSDFTLHEGDTINISRAVW